MEILNYLLAVIVSFMSLFLGMFLAFNTKEELKLGKRFFIIFKKIILILIIIFMLFIATVNRNMITFGVIFAASLFLVFDNKKEIYNYALLGFVIAYSLNFLNLFLLQGSLIFIYGLVSGTLTADIKKGYLFNIRNIFLRSFSYLITALISPLFLSKF